MITEGVQVIGFDADDTLWHNENLFRTTEDRLAEMLSRYESAEPVPDVIYRKQMNNLPLYGYGIKAFTFALLETAIEVSGGRIPAGTLQEIMNMGKAMLREPVVLFDHVEEVLSKLSARYKLIVITKGDLVDQERKLAVSGLSPFFHHLEVISRKDEAAYSRLLARLDISPASFVMVGNSLKSDVLPILNLGGRAIHIPYETTWEHERIEGPIRQEGFHEISAISELLPLFL